MIYIVDGYKFNDPDKVAQYITETIDDNVYDDMLDECYGEVNIGGFKYATSIALKETDPTAYRCGKNDYYDNLSSDISSEVDRLTDYGTDNFYGFVVESYDDWAIQENLDEIEDELDGMDKDDDDYKNLLAEKKEKEAELKELLDGINDYFK